MTAPNHDRSSGGTTAPGLTMAAEPMGPTPVDQGSLQWGDYDNDGTSTGSDGANRRVILYRNDGGNSFAARRADGAQRGGAPGALQWCDYDTDGDLDLGVAGFDGRRRARFPQRQRGDVHQVAG